MTQQACCEGREGAQLMTGRRNKDEKTDRVDDTGSRSQPLSPVGPGKLGLRVLQGVEGSTTVPPKRIGWPLHGLARAPGGQRS